MTDVEEVLTPLVVALRAARQLEQEVCYHEAAHAVACLEFGFPIEYIEMGRGLLGGANGRGLVKSRGSDDKGMGTDEMVISFLVGTEAERHLHELPQISGDYNPEGGAADLEFVEWHIRTYGGNLNALRARSLAYVEERWARIEAVAAQVLDRRRIAEARARRAAQSAS